MAVSFATPSPLQFASGTDASSYTTTGQTAGANGKLYLITVGSTVASGTANQPTLTHAGGLDCVLIATRTRGIYRETLFRASKPSGVSAATFTAAFGGQTQQGCMITVEEIDGQDTSGTDGSGAIVQFGSNDGSGASQPSVTLAAFADAVNNAAWLATYHNGTSGVPEAGFTELSDYSQSNPSRHEASAYKIGQDTSPSYTGITTHNTWIAIALEIKVAAGGATVTLDAAIAGLGALTGDFVRQENIAVAVSGFGALSADFVRREDIAVAVSGLGTLSADLVRTVGLEAVIAGLGVTSADLTVTAGGVVDLAVAIAGAAGVSAQYVLDLLLAASIAGLGEVSADISVSRPPTIGLGGDPNYQTFQTIRSA